jgi:hypothetical protein
MQGGNSPVGKVELKGAAGCGACVAAWQLVFGLLTRERHSRAELTRAGVGIAVMHWHIDSGDSGSGP